MEHEAFNKYAEPISLFYPWVLTISGLERKIFSKVKHKMQQTLQILNQ